MHADRLDACPEHDLRLLELATGPAGAAEWDAHLAGCPRCAAAFAGYRLAVLAAAAAFEVHPVLRQARPRGTPWPVLAASVALAAAAVLLALVPPAVTSADPVLSVHPEPGAVVLVLGPDRARIETGKSAFVLRDGGRVETPLGALTCGDCRFTVAVGACETSLPRDEIDRLCVTIAVQSGRLGSPADDRRLALGPGETGTWSLDP